MNKNLLKTLLKLLLTALALYLVFRKVDSKITFAIVEASNGFYLWLALAFFVLSKVFSAIRLNYFFKDLGLQLPAAQNFKLYGIGMFYNLFLPGGIGGDGYKVYLLNKYYKIPVKQLLQAVLLDRISGLAVLLFFMLLLLFGVNIRLVMSFDIHQLAVAALVALFVGFYSMMHVFFKPFVNSMGITLLYAVLVQAMQLVCAYFILLALGIGSDLLAYQFVFLLSSIVAVLPLTIGGVGARELVFILSHDYIGIDKNAAVAFSLLFFLITAITSLVGVFFKFHVEEKSVS